MSQANECLKGKLLDLEEQKELLAKEMNCKETELNDKIKIVEEEFSKAKTEFEMKVSALAENEALLSKQHEDTLARFAELSEEKKSLEMLLKEKAEDINNLMTEKMDLSIQCEEKQAALLDVEQSLNDERNDNLSKLAAKEQELKICQESLIGIETETVHLKNQLQDANIQHEEMLKAHQDHVYKLVEGHMNEVGLKEQELKICQESLVGLETQTTLLKNQLNDVKIQQEVMSRDNQNHVAQLIGCHKVEVEAKEQELKICLKSFESLQTENLNLKNQLEDACIQQKDMAEAHEKHAAQLLDGHKEEVELKEAKIQKINLQLEEANTIIRDMTQAYQDHVTQLTEGHKQEVEVKEAKIQKLHDNCEMLDKTCKDLQVNLMKAEDLLETKGRHFNDVKESLETRVSSMEEQLRDSTIELNSKTKELTELLASKDKELQQTKDELETSKQLLSEWEESKKVLEKKLENLIKLQTCFQQLKIIDKASQVSILNKIYSIILSISKPIWDRTYLGALTIEATNQVPVKYVDMIQNIVNKTDDVACSYLGLV